MFRQMDEPCRNRSKSEISERYAIMVLSDRFFVDFAVRRNSSQKFVKLVINTPHFFKIYKYYFSKI